MDAESSILHHSCAPVADTMADNHEEDEEGLQVCSAVPYQGFCLYLASRVPQDEDEYEELSGEEEEELQDDEEQEEGEETELTDEQAAQMQAIARSLGLSGFGRGPQITAGALRRVRSRPGVCVVTSVVP